MTIFPIISSTANNTVLPQAAKDLLTGDSAHIWYTSPDKNSTFYIDGALKPWPGIQDGMVLSDGIHGMSPDFKLIDLKSARQPGVTYTGSLFDVMLIDLNLEAHGNAAWGVSRVVSEWMGAWHPTKTGVMEYITLDGGYWYCKPRLAKTWGDQWKQHWRTIKTAKLTHNARVDGSFWLGVPSIDEFAPGSGSGNGFLRLANIGEEDAYPTAMFYGPGLFKFSNGPGSTNMITFGPLLEGQVVVMPLLPRLNNAIDISAGVPQTLSVEQQTIKSLINWVTNNNVPPLLQQFESLFGILPPQGPLMSLLTGRYSNPIPGVAQPEFASLSQIAVSVTETGGSSTSKIAMRVDPMRRWPEALWPDR